YLSLDSVISTACSICFFFSSRRRHTRFSRDWSSDVCSSDLERACQHQGVRWRQRLRRHFGNGAIDLDGRWKICRNEQVAASATRSEERRVGKVYSSRNSQDQ